MSRGTQTRSFVAARLGVTLLFTAATLANPASAAAATSTRPVAPVMSSPGRTPAKAAPANVARAARRIADLARKRRALPARPQPKYGPWQTATCSRFDEPQGLAGGGFLQPGMMIVAHKSLPFGTKIQFSYKGRSCIAEVKDRGPYVRGREFDLGPGTADALGFDGVDQVAYRLAY